MIATRIETRGRKKGSTTVEGRTEKVCGCCKKEKRISQFYRDKSRTDGREGNCKDCRYTRTTNRIYNFTRY